MFGWPGEDQLTTVVMACYAIGEVSYLFPFYHLKLTLSEKVE